MSTPSLGLAPRPGSVADAFLSSFTTDFFPQEIKLPIQPQHGPQADLLASDADEILIGGARGGGKSYGLLLDAAQHILRFRGGARCVIFRRQFVDLEDIIETSHTIFPLMGGKYSPGSAVWRFSGGGQLRFRYIAKEIDATKYQGHQYTYIGVEEAGTYASYETLKKLKAALRSAAGVKVRMVLNCNPGGVGHNWLKSRFITAGPPNTPITEVDDHGGEWTRVFIPALIEDNKILIDNDPGYITRLMKSGPPWLVNAWRHGDWNIVAGGMFDDLFAPAVYDSPIVLPPFDRPLHWKVERSIDWGSSAPFSIGWWVTSDGTPITPIDGRERFLPPGSKVLIDEWYGCHPDRVEHANEGIGTLACDVAAAISAREIDRFGKVCARGVADSAMWAKVGSSSGSIAEEFELAGIYNTPSLKGPGSRAAGWEVMRKMLTAAAERRDAPGLYVSSSCSDWLRTVPSLPRSKTNLDDADTSAEDHAADQTRYYLTTPLESVTMGHWRV